MRICTQGGQVQCRGAVSTSGSRELCCCWGQPRLIPGNLTAQHPWDQCKGWVGARGAVLGAPTLGAFTELMCTHGTSVWVMWGGRTQQEALQGWSRPLHPSLQPGWG